MDRSRFLSRVFILGAALTACAVARAAADCNLTVNAGSGGTFTRQCSAPYNALTVAQWPTYISNSAETVESRRPSHGGGRRKRGRS